MSGIFENLGAVTTATASTASTVSTPEQRAAWASQPDGGAFQRSLMADVNGSALALLHDFVQNRWIPAIESAAVVNPPWLQAALAIKYADGIGLAFSTYAGLLWTQLVAVENMSPAAKAQIQPQYVQGVTFASALMRQKLPPILLPGWK